MKNLAKALLILSIFQVSNALASEKPFWTEKSVYVEGDSTFVVGVGSDQPSIEKARLKASEAAQREIQAHLMDSRFEVQMDTQMVFDETHKDHTVTSYRLFRIPNKRLAEIRQFLTTETAAKAAKGSQTAQPQTSPTQPASETWTLEEASLDPWDYAYVQKNLKEYRARQGK